MAWNASRGLVAVCVVSTFAAAWLWTLLLSFLVESSVVAFFNTVACIAAVFLAANISRCVWACCMLCALCVYVLCCVLCVLCVYVLCCVLCVLCVCMLCVVCAVCVYVVCCVCVVWALCGLCVVCVSNECGISRSVLCAALVLFVFDLLRRVLRVLFGKHQERWLAARIEIEPLSLTSLKQIRITTDQFILVRSFNAEKEKGCECVSAYVSAPVHV